jgi:hypothetical protein
MPYFCGKIPVSNTYDSTYMRKSDALLSRVVGLETNARNGSDHKDETTVREITTDR